MEPNLRQGIVTSVNHEKNYVSIEYLNNDKKRTITCRIDDKAQMDDRKQKQKKHTYRVGDEVSFHTKGADRGTRLIAYNIKFLYNNALQKLIQRAETDNRFTGYLKIVDDSYFVKEWESYLFFPLSISKWEIPPGEKHFNEVFEFKLVDLDKPDKISAELFNHDYIPEFRKAVQHFKNKIPVEAVIYNISPFAVYINLFGETIQAKIVVSEKERGSLKLGDKIQVLITYLTGNRVVVALHQAR